MKLLVLLFALTAISAVAVFSQPREILLPNGKKALLRTDNTWSLISDTISIKTDDGENILLLPDSVWRYFGGEADPNLKRFYKPPAANKLMKSEMGKYGIWIDAGKWKEKKKNDSVQSSIDFQFEGKNGKLFAIVIFDPSLVHIDTLRKVSLENYRRASPGAAFTYEEKRVVNGSKVLFVKMETKSRSKSLTYYNYYYSGKEGTIQALTFGEKSVLKKNEKDVLNFLNGLIIF